MSTTLEYTELAVQCAIEFFAAMGIALSSLYHVDPLLAGFVYGAMKWIAGPISGAYFSPVNTLFVGDIHKRSWYEIGMITISQLTAGAVVYMFYKTGGLDYI